MTGVQKWHEIPDERSGGCEVRIPKQFALLGIRSQGSFQAQVQMRLYSGVADENISCNAVPEISNG